MSVVTARVFYVLRGFLISPFILNNSAEMAAPFNVVSHPRCCEPSNPWKSFDLLRGSNLWPLAPSSGCLTARPPELTYININKTVCFYLLYTKHNKANQESLFESRDHHNAKWTITSQDHQLTKISPILQSWFLYFVNIYKCDIWNGYSCRLWHYFRSGNYRISFIEITNTHGKNLVIGVIYR